MHWNQTSDEIANLVHRKSVEILSEVGFSVPDSETLAKLKSAGFLVDDESQMVRITKDLLDEALHTLPQNVKLYRRGSQVGLDFKSRSHFMGAGTPVNVQDLDTGERRAATRQDVRDFVTLQDALFQVDIVRPTVTATDMGEGSDLIEIAELLRFTQKPIVHRTLSPDRVDAAVAMLAAVAGGEKSLREYPNFATLYCPISPAYFTEENIQCMLRWAHHGVPITLLSMAMGGASAPATLLGELVVINLEILAWMIVLQILFPGTPLLYGSVSSVLDMRTGILPLGAPERGMINSGAAIMANFYGIPSMCGGLSTDAKEVDVQAGFEKSVTAFPLLVEGASIIYGVGAVDAGSAISYSQMVMDNELIAGLRRMMEGITVHDLDEEIELIKANIPRGNFLKEKHTRRNYKRHWQPELLNKDAYETWVVDRVQVAEKSRLKAKDILVSHQPLCLPAEVEAEIERILRKHLAPDFALNK
ncbi:MAG: trimethylamine methyltransferase family protein [Anaerolineales bacterium]|nr:trimethylamine methyltransferase family protein [Chloroflexota bacterium]MBL6980041.1 trimethylamine methyltransferase family protein [Anaerolineales bacterium]